MSFIYINPYILASSDVATGGTVTNITDGGVNYRVHTFRSSGNFIVNAGVTLSVTYLVVAGGGGGGGLGSPAGGGGGGAGGYLTGTATVSTSTYVITVGAGGVIDTSGANSVFSTFTAIGGGKGGRSGVAFG